jgi:hypothetical protein
MSRAPARAISLTAQNQQLLWENQALGAEKKSNEEKLQKYRQKEEEIID